MVRLARILAAVVLSVTLAAAVVVWVGIPYVERRWTFFPASSTSALRWQMPPDAREVAFSTADGGRLVGWFFAGTAPPNGITVLLLHGNEGVLPDYVPEAQRLQALGFDLLMFNYRGFGRSAGTTRGEATLYSDGAAARRYLVRERGVDPNAVALLGVSLGAAVAADLARSGPCRAVALIGGFASARQQATELGGWRSRPWLPHFLLDLLSSPLDTVGMIGRANCPVLIVHGEDDRAVPLAQARALHDAARPPKRLVVVPGAAHGLPVADGRRYLDEVAAFFIDRR